MAQKCSVKSARKFANANRLHQKPLGLILWLCFCLGSETVNAYPQKTPTHLTPSWQHVAQTKTSNQAQQLLDEGMQLFNQGTAESLQQAITKWEAALPLWREAGDKSKEALTLLRIGSVYDDLGEKQKALSNYNQALPLRRTVGDHSGEAITLLSIGLVYNELGEKQKALSYYSQALPLVQAVGERSGEASTLNNIGLVYDDLGKRQKALSYYKQALSL
jgi:tetratricopeptide (TPR) repeat protein